ncbi:MAG: hypothetical protein WAV72_27150 [Bradyrhizobium sp.]
MAVVSAATPMVRWSATAAPREPANFAADESSTTSAGRSAAAAPWEPANFAADETTTTSTGTSAACETTSTAANSTTASAADSTTASAAACDTTSTSALTLRRCPCRRNEGYCRNGQQRHDRFIQHDLSPGSRTDLIANTSIRSRLARFDRSQAAMRRQLQKICKRMPPSGFDQSASNATL